MCREVVNVVHEISHGSINLDEYRWNVIDEKKFEKQKSDYYRKLEDIIDDVIQEILF